MPLSYAHPEVLVSPEWLSGKLEDPTIRIVEVSAQAQTFWEGHIPGAISWSWQTQLSEALTRDIPSRQSIELLLSQAGIAPETTVILYGDHNNWFAAWAFWVLKTFGHKDVRLLNGGRKLWIDQARPLVLDEVDPVESLYIAPEADASFRALLADVREAQEQGTAQLLDVRTPAEFRGELAAPPGSLESPLRAGHIPGAKNLFWALTTMENGAFRSMDELRSLFDLAKIDFSRPVFTYCRIGERSSHTWFVLRYLLGHPDVRNYDGSWMEWGNLVGAPIAR